MLCSLATSSSARNSPFTLRGLFCCQHFPILRALVSEICHSSNLQQVSPENCTFLQRMGGTILFFHLRNFAESRVHSKMDPNCPWKMNSSELCPSLDVAPIWIVCEHEIFCIEILSFSTSSLHDLYLPSSSLCIHSKIFLSISTLTSCFAMRFHSLPFLSSLELSSPAE